MVQLNLLSGKKAGTSWVARRFPVRIGRSVGCALQLEEDGIWDRHLQLDLSPAQGFVLTAQPNALVSVNGQTVAQTILRNGDTIQIGSLKMQFWLSPTRQAGLRFREALIWAGLVALCVVQIILIYRLPH